MWTTEESWFDSWRCKRLLSNPSLLTAVGRTRPLFCKRELRGYFPQGGGAVPAGREVHPSHLVSKSRMSAAVPSLPQLPLWRAQGQRYLLPFNSIYKIIRLFYIFARLTAC
jgi:hypothetical protein